MKIKRLVRRQARLGGPVRLCACDSSACTFVGGCHDCLVAVHIQACPLPMLLAAAFPCCPPPALLAARHAPVLLISRSASSPTRSRKTGERRMYTPADTLLTGLQTITPAGQVAPWRISLLSQASARVYRWLAPRVSAATAPSAASDDARACKHACYHAATAKRGRHGGSHECMPDPRRSELVAQSAH
jgi:hypothetical protein